MRLTEAGSKGEQQTAVAITVNGEQNNNLLIKNEVTENGNTTAFRCGEHNLEFKPGSRILARWYDELFHPALLLKVQHDGLCCEVEFDEGTVVSIPAGHMQWSTLREDKEIRCSLCHMEHSMVPNEIVLCDGCGLGYHQRCHHPVISPELLQTDGDWFCVLCTYKRQNKNGTVQRINSSTQVNMEYTVMDLEVVKPKEKKTLPYKLSTLHWTEDHYHNVEKAYCYCGGKGEWWLKMVQCVRCKQWFHESCLSTRPYPSQMCGDAMYLFLCSLCNSGHEALHRIDLRWVDIAHLALFNLSLGRSKYADFDLDLMPWINNKWKQLNVGKLEPIELGQRFMQVLRALRENTAMFRNGTEMRKRAAWYGLRIRSAPCVPTVTLAHEVGVVQPSVLRDWLARSMVQVTYKEHLSNVAIYIPNLFRHSQHSSGGMGKKRKRLSSDDTDMDIKPKIKRKKINNTTSSEPPKPKTNGIHPVTSHSKKTKASSTPSTSATPCPSSSLLEENLPKLPRKKRTRKQKVHRSLLDRQIPPVGDFAGIHNPFLYVGELEVESAKAKARQQHFSAFVNGLPAEKSPQLVNGDAGGGTVNGALNNGDCSAASGRGESRKSRTMALNGHQQNGIRNNGHSVEASLERCVYEGDALEWDEFQVRAMRTDPNLGTVQMFTEWYDDMPELKMK